MFTMIQRLKHFFQKRFVQWANKRIPISNQHTFSQKNLFIFPSMQGFWFLLVTLLLWLLGTNYENNIVLSLAFLLTTLMVVTILHSYSNLSGLSIELQGASPVFQGEIAEIKILLTRNSKRIREDIGLAWEENDPVHTELVSIIERTVSVSASADQRGWFNPGVLHVKSYFPLGLIRCWARLRFPPAVLVYPKPVDAGPLPPSMAIADEGVESARVGADEFVGFREYHVGDSMKNVSWKHFARGMDVMSKEYSAYVDQRLWLDWDYLGGMDTEARLSRLCYWVLEASKERRDVGLRLPGIEVSPAQGSQHIENMLRELALFRAGEANGNVAESSTL
ncbi:DUF58 domain-containing protein [Aurantivibrio plasticivorans]